MLAHAAPQVPLPLPGTGFSPVLPIASPLFSLVLPIAPPPFPASSRRFPPLLPHPPNPLRLVLLGSVRPSLAAGREVRTLSILASGQHADCLAGPGEVLQELPQGALRGLGVVSVHGEEVEGSR